MKSSIVLAGVLTTFALSHTARAESEPPRKALRVDAAVLGGLSVASTTAGLLLSTADSTGTGFAGVDARYGGFLLTGFGIATGGASLGVVGASFAPPSAKRALLVGGAVTAGLGLLISAAGAFLMGGRDTQTISFSLCGVGMGATGVGSGLFVSALEF